MNYPKTDDDWEKLAECIVIKHTGVSPEVVGSLTVDATAVIFTWYKGEERSRALSNRQYARDRLMELARQAGCPEEPPWMRPKEVVEHGSYVIFTNLDTGETKQYYNIFPPDSPEVVSAAMTIKPTLERKWGENIKFDIIPAEKLPTEGLPGRPVPKTYGDWVDLGEDIKKKAGINDFETTAEVNEHLYHIYKEEEDPLTAGASKMWLVRKAGELGIT